MIVDPIVYCQQFSAPGNPNKLIEEMVIHLLGLSISQQHRDQLKKDILLSGQSEDYYWTNAWDTYIATPTNATNTKYVRTAITNLIKYMVELPEYQLC